MYLVLVFPVNFHNILYRFFMALFPNFTWLKLGRLKTSKKRLQTRATFQTIWSLRCIKSEKQIAWNKTEIGIRWYYRKILVIRS